MRNAILGAASAALALSLSSGALFAQETAAPTVDFCEELVRFLQSRGDVEPAAPVALEDARNFQRANDVVACRDGFVRVREAGIVLPAAVVAVIDAPEGEQAPAEGANIVVQQPAPAVTVEQAPPQVTVQQPQPEVTVSQPQPEIIVNQPAPVVTVDIPQPEIIVRMPEPQVSVSQAQPQVEVVQPQPQVQVVQQEQPQVQVQEGAQATVQVEQPQGQANVQLQQEGEPRVTYQRAEPQVTVNQAEGQPTVRVERMAEAAPAAGAAAPAADVQAAEAEPAEAAVEEPVATAAVAPAEEPTRLFPVSELMDREVYNLRGEQIGDIERILRDAEGQLYAVLGHGGFLGLGEKQILVRMQDMAMAGDRLVIPGLTDDQIRAVPEFDLDEVGAAYTELDRNENADLSLYEG